jgi:hypothetical protein
MIRCGDPMEAGDWRGPGSFRDLRGPTATLTSGQAQENRAAPRNPTKGVRTGKQEAPTSRGRSVGIHAAIALLSLLTVQTGRALSAVTTLRVGKPAPYRATLGAGLRTQSGTRLGRGEADADSVEVSFAADST